MNASNFRCRGTPSMSSSRSAHVGRSLRCCRVARPLSCCTFAISTLEAPAEQLQRGTSNPRQGIRKDATELIGNTAMVNTQSISMCALALLLPQLLSSLRCRST